MYTISRTLGHPCRPNDVAFPLLIFLTYVQREARRFSSSEEPGQTNAESASGRAGGRRLLVKDGGRHLAGDVGAGGEVLELAGGDVAVDDDDAAVALEADGQLGAGLVDGELAGVDAAGGRGLHQLEAAVGLVDGVGEQRVRGELGAVGLVEVGDLQEALEARRDDEKLVVGLRAGCQLVSSPLGNPQFHDLPTGRSRPPWCPWVRCRRGRGCSRDRSW